MRVIMVYLYIAKEDVMKKYNLPKNTKTFYSMLLAFILLSK